MMMTTAEHETTGKLSTFHIVDQGYDISAVDKFTQEAYALIDRLSDALLKSETELAEFKKAHISKEEDVALSVKMITLAEAEASKYVAEQTARADEKLEETSTLCDSLLKDAKQEKETIEAEVDTLKENHSIMLERLIALHSNELNALTKAAAELAETNK